MRRVAWDICTQLFYVGVVLVVFGELSGRSEILMVALFGITYALVRVGQIQSGLALANLARNLQQELDWMKVKLIPDFRLDIESQKEANQANYKARISLMIEAAGASMISLICLFKIWSALNLGG